MCGRYVSATSPEDIAAYFDVDRVDEALHDADAEPNFNVAPTAQVPVVRERDEERLLEPFVWGLVPFWAKDAKIGAKMINARAETVAEKGAFKHAFAKRRCIVPADGFYEWTTVGASTSGGSSKPHKQPWHIAIADGSIMAFAGLYEVWRGPPAAEESDAIGPAAEGPTAANPLLSCTIVTTTANATIEPLHDRMPVVLAAPDWDLWLDPTYRDIEHLQEMLRPAPSELFVTHSVTTEVNNARNNGAHLREPAGQGTLL